MDTFYATRDVRVYVWGLLVSWRASARLLGGLESHLPPAYEDRFACLRCQNYTQVHPVRVP